MTSFATKVKHMQIGYGKLGYRLNTTAGLVKYIHSSLL